MQSRANGQALISGRGLNPGPPKWSLLKKFSIGDTVQRAAPGHDQIFGRHPLVQLLQQMKENFFETMLHGVSEIHVTLCNFCVWVARRAKVLHHAVGKMSRELDRSVVLNLHALIAAQRHEVIQVEAKGRIVELNNLAHSLAVSVLPVRCQPHHFAFIAIFFVADELADHGVETAQRMRQEDSLQHFNFVAFAARHHGGNKIAGAVITEACRLFPRRTVVSARNVSHVVLEVMLLKAQLGCINIERLGQQRPYISHGLLALAQANEIQDLCWIRQRILHFFGQVGIAVLPHRYVIDIRNPRAHRIQTGFNRQAQETPRSVSPG